MESREKTLETSNEYPSSLTTPPSTDTPLSTKTKKGSSFWLSFLAIVLATFLSALDLTATSTTLPTIVADLKGGDKFIWIGTAFGLSSTAFLPLTGSLADAFGRRPLMLGTIIFFAIGSALSGAAQNMNMLIAARTIQGVGGGGILNLSDIIVSDIVPLAERGLYQGIIVLTWAVASGVGPPIGGALAEKASWRWLFYINLPLTGIAFVSVLFFLRVRTPPGSLREKLTRIDWFGNFLIISGTTLTNVALAFAGAKFSWSSVQVLAPLIIGLALFPIFMVYEKYIPKQPTIPWDIVSNRTTTSALFATFVHSIIAISVIYYLPVYFQAALDASPLHSGIDILPIALVLAPFALVSSVAVQVLGRYIPSNVVGWTLIIVGSGLLSLLKAGSTTGQWVGFQILISAGLGMIYTATIFPLLAPLPIERSAAAIAFYNFIRSSANTWGITISGAILQNGLLRRLPSEFSSQIQAQAHAQIGSNVQIAYAAIPIIPSLPEPLKTQVHKAFSETTSEIWKIMIGFAGAGLLSVLLLKEVKMHTTNDERFQLEKKEKEERKKEGVVEESV